MSSAGREVRIWSIFDRQHRLVLALSDEPGQVNFSRMLDEDADPVEVPFATLQCYDPRSEAELLNLLFKSTDVEEFIGRLKDAGYKVIVGRPRPMKFARL